MVMKSGRGAQGMERKKCHFYLYEGKKEESRPYRSVSYTLSLRKVMKELTWKLFLGSQRTGMLLRAYSMDSSRGIILEQCDKLL